MFRFWREFTRRLGYLPRRSTFENELDQEIEFHLHSRIEELIESGFRPSDARAQARKEFGRTSHVREESRGAWQFSLLEDFLADLKYAARTLRTNGVFTGAALLSLALGIGANLAIFSLTMEFLFSRPSVRDSNSLAYVMLGGNSNAALAQYSFLRDAHIFLELAGFNPETEANWRFGGETHRIFGARVTENFFDVTGVPVALGRPIHAGDGHSAVISDRFWKGRLGSERGIIGRSLIFDGSPFTVVGVLPANHRTLIGFGFSPDAYLALDPKRGDATTVMLYARLFPQTTRKASFGRLLGLCRQMDQIFPLSQSKWSNNSEVRGVTGLERLNILPELPIPEFFAMLMTVVGLVFLIACANVASLLLARAVGRQHELAIRQSIGASRGRIVRQLLTESLLLSVLGMTAALLLDLAIGVVVNRIPLPLPVPVRLHVEPELRLFGYAAALAMISAILCGLMPALKATKRDRQAALKLGERSVTMRLGFRRILVVAQLTTSVVVLFTGILFLRNLMLSNSLSPGFDIHHTVWAYMRLVPERYAFKDSEEAGAAIASVAQRALTQLRALAGIGSAAAAAIVPLNDNLKFGGNVLVSGRQPRHVTYTGDWVSEDYFETMAIPVLRGRDFLTADRKGSPPVVILNRSMARQLFEDGNPIGQEVRFGEEPPATVVGVVQDSKYFSLGEKDLPAVYWPFAQSSRAAVNLNFLIRTARPESILKRVNAALGNVDKTAALEIKPMYRALGLALLPSRVGAALLGTIGVLALLLSSVGLFGVLTYSVARHTREIGIRVALGAQPAAVGYMVLRNTFMLVGTGLALGGALGYFVANGLEMFLVPELSSHDPASLLAVFTALALVGACATLSPLIRALRVAPVVALRYE